MWHPLPHISCLLQNTQIPNSWCKPLPFFKKRISFCIVIYCFWHLGKPFSSYSSLQTWGFRRSKNALPGSQRGVAPSQRTLPQGLSLWDRQTHKALTTSLSVGRRGSLSASPLYLTGPFSQPHPWGWESLPTLTSTAPCPGQNCCHRRSGQ